MEFSGLKHPVQNYPFRQPMDIIKPMIPYVTDKVVCDIGCGCGDILTEIGKYAKDIHGIELSPKFKNKLSELGVDRPFITWGDFFSVNIPKSDVYYIWVSSDKSLNRRIVDLLPSGCQIIDATTKIELFNDFTDLKLIERVSYKFDESNLLSGTNVMVGGVTFPIKSENIIRIYEKL